jgi:cephalosporin-C deacetylase
LAQFDLPAPQLRAFTPALAVPADLEAFWAETLAETRQHPLAASFTPVETPLAVFETFDVTFSGFGGVRVKAWLTLPRRRSGPLPAVVEFIGYGGGRGLPHERTLFAAAGYAHLVMDTRGQGSGWRVGETPDPDPVGAVAAPGFMTRGILDPHRYYYRRVYADAVRAVEAVGQHEAVDRSRVVVTGASQGGGLALAVAGLVDDLAGVAPDVPFLCHFERAVTLVDSDPYAEIARYLRAHRDHVDQAFATLAYVDGAVLCRRANAPALFSVALMDETCPPSTVYAAYNHYGTVQGGTGATGTPAKTIIEYPFNNHEGGEGFHDLEKFRWLAELLSA